LRHDRVIGVIRFDLSTEATSSSTVSAVLDPDEIASRFISKLRQTDCVYITDENHVCVFISLLHTRNDLNRIAGRLFADLSNLAESTALKLEFVPGTAMYPLDGYSGEALMEAALYRIKPMTQGITIQSGDHKQLSIPGAAPERSRVFPEKPLPYQGRLQ